MAITNIQTNNGSLNGSLWSPASTNSSSAWSPTVKGRFKVEQIEYEYHIPLHIWMEVAKYLDPQSKMRMSFVCKDFRLLLQDSSKITREIKIFSNVYQTDMHKLHKLALTQMNTEKVVISHIWTLISKISENENTNTYFNMLGEFIREINIKNKRKVKNKLAKAVKFGSKVLAGAISANDAIRSKSESPKTNDKTRGRSPSETKRGKREKIRTQCRDLLEKREPDLVQFNALEAQYEKTKGDSFELYEATLEFIPIRAEFEARQTPMPSPVSSSESPDPSETSEPSSETE